MSRSRTPSVPFDLYLITEPLLPGGVARSVQRALQAQSHDRDRMAGRIAVQLRDKSASTNALLPLAQELRALTLAHDAALIINGDLELASSVRADGVQLPQNGTSIAAARARLGSSVLIGASCHDASSLATAADGGADFATLSPVFEVKDKGVPLGVAGFGALAAQARLPLFALGGLEPEHVAPLLAAGAHGVAVIRSVLFASDPGSVVARFLRALDAKHAKARAES